MGPMWGTGFNVTYDNLSQLSLDFSVILVAYAVSKRNFFKEISAIGPAWHFLASLIIFLCQKSSKISWRRQGSKPQAARQVVRDKQG